MMDDQTLLRYSRQIMLPEVDIDGQQRLLSAHAVIIGAGGLGSPVALYLAAAGVGRITIADADHVVALDQYLEGDALRQLVASAQVVLDCTDRFSSRYAVNEASQKAGVPLISGAAIRFSGQLALFDPRDAACPCYACLYPPDEHGDEALSCSESGVMAPLVGLIGCFQAVEAFKLLSGAGTPHQGLSTFDGLSGQWRHFQVPRDPACAVCAHRR